jgi:hypothetical protein
MGLICFTYFSIFPHQIYFKERAISLCSLQKLKLNFTASMPFWQTSIKSLTSIEEKDKIGKYISVILMIAYK